MLKLHYFGYLTWRANALGNGWDRLRAGGERGDGGWDGWMTSRTQWTCIWVNSRRQWRKKPGVLQSMGLQKAGHNWATEKQQPLIYKKHRIVKFIEVKSRMVIGRAWRGGDGSYYLRKLVSVLQDEKSSGGRRWWCLHSIVNVLNTMSHTLKVKRVHFMLWVLYHITIIQWKWQIDSRD